MKKFFNYEKIFKINFNIVIVFIILNIIGIFVLYSSVNLNFFPLVFKEILFFLFFFIFSFFLISLKSDIIYKYSYLIYIMSIILLIYTKFFGVKIMGARRWIKFIFFNIQTSEIIKITMPLALSRYFSENKNINIVNLISILFIIILPFVLVLLQPDLGTSIIILLLGISFFFFIKINIKYIIFLGIIALLFLLSFLKFGLKDYQKKRIEVFLNKNNEKLTYSYNKNQSLTSIGSGGLYGMGYNKGKQNTLMFLPENHTDFIFATFAEEFGFISVFIILLIYIYFLFSILLMAYKNNLIFNKLVTLIYEIVFFLHITINISMISGLIPIVGIPLPFFSYGGTISFISFVMISMILNLNSNIYMFE